MCALFPSMRRQSISIWTKTSKLRLLSCSCPLARPSAYFLAEKENDRKVPSGLTMWPDPVADPTTGSGAAGALCASHPASGNAATSTSRTTYLFTASSPPSRRSARHGPEHESLPTGDTRQAKRRPTRALSVAPVDEQTRPGCRFRTNGDSGESSLAQASGFFLDAGRGRSLRYTAAYALGRVHNAPSARPARLRAGASFGGLASDRLCLRAKRRRGDHVRDVPRRARRRTDRRCARQGAAARRRRTPAGALDDLDRSPRGPAENERARARNRRRPRRMGARRGAAPPDPRLGLGDVLGALGGDRAHPRLGARRVRRRSAARHGPETEQARLGGGHLLRHRRGLGGNHVCRCRGVLATAAPGTAPLDPGRPRSGRCVAVAPSWWCGKGPTWVAGTGAGTRKAVGSARRGLPTHSFGRCRTHRMNE